MTPWRDAAHLDEVASLVGRSRPACGSVTVVGIDGPSGSGKTTLAALVGEHLGVPVLHMDDLYPGWEGLADAVPLLVSQVLDPLSRGERASYRRWDWTHERWSEQVEPVPVAGSYVLEGVGSTVRPAGDYVAVKVWVEADRDVRFARGMARDGEAYRPHWERWARQEDALFAADRTRERADLVLDTTDLGAGVPHAAPEAVS